MLNTMKYNTDIRVNRYIFIKKNQGHRSLFSTILQVFLEHHLIFLIRDFNPHDDWCATNFHYATHLQWSNHYHQSMLHCLCPHLCFPCFRSLTHRYIWSFDPIHYYDGIDTLLFLLISFLSTRNVSVLNKYWIITLFLINLNLWLSIVFLPN